MKVTIPPYAERLVLYLLLVQVVSRVVLEFGLGMWWFELAELKLLMFSGLLSLDHAVWLLRGRFRSLPSDPVILFLLALFSAIVLHGISVGLVWGQGLFSVFDDSAPFLLLIISVIRFHDPRAINYERMFQRMLWATIAAIWISILFGALGVARGLPTKVSPHGHMIAIYIALYAAHLALYRGRWGLLTHTVLFWGAFVLSLDDVNRSTMAYLGLALAIASVLRVRIDRAGAGIGVLLIVLAPMVLMTIVPEGSKTDRRIRALFDADLRAQSVSISSRDLETQQIAAQLEWAGTGATVFGQGHGASYPYFVHGIYEPNHGHAHYAFAFFNLRYGAIGKAYVVLIGALLVLGAYVALRSATYVSLFAAFLCLACLIYLFTWVNFFMYFMGLPLMALARPVLRPALRHPIINSNRNKEAMRCV